MRRQRPAVRWSELSILDRLAEHNPQVWKVCTSLLVNPFSASSSKIERAIEFTQSQVNVSENTKTPILLLALREVYQRLSDLQEQLGSASLHNDELREQAALEVEKEYRELSNKLRRLSGDDTSIEYTLLLPFRARVQRLRGTCLYYAKEFTESTRRYSEARNLFNQFGESFGPVTEIDAYELSTEVASIESAQDLPETLKTRHDLVTDEFDGGKLPASPWVEGTASWLAEVSRKHLLVWDETPDLPALDLAVQWLNRMAHLRAMSIFEGNWVYAMIRNGNVSDARASAKRANALVIDAYFGKKLDRINQNMTVDWYLLHADGSVPEIQNRAARQALFVMASAIKSGTSVDEERSALAQLIRFERDSDRCDARESAERGVLNVRKGLHMPDVADELARILRGIS